METSLICNAKALFVSQPQRGHLNPLMAIASHVENPVFANFGPPELEKLLGSRGLTCHSLPSPVGPWAAAAIRRLTGFWETGASLELFTARPEAYARALAGLIAQERPDIVVADFACPGAGMAAELCDIPWVSIYHAGLAYPGPGIPPFASGWPIGGPEAVPPLGPPPGGHRWILSFLAAWMLRRLWRRLDRARHALGLPRYEGERGTNFWTSPWATLILSAAEAEAPRYPLPQGTFFVGPCLDARPSSLELPASARKRVYLSLGTVFNDRPTWFGRILGALGGGRYQVVVSAGAAYPQLAPLAGLDFLIYPSLPQMDVLRQVDVVVSHGGNNTVNETLAAGKPLLVLPIGGEQSDNASRVVYLGAGLRGDIRNDSPDQIRQKVELLLEAPHYSQRAREISRILAHSDGPTTVARFLKRIAETRRPVIRPVGYPETIFRETALPWQEGEPG